MRGLANKYGRYIYGNRRDLSKIVAYQSNSRYSMLIVSDNVKFAKRFHSTACSTVKLKRNQLALLPHDSVSQRKGKECSHCKDKDVFVKKSSKSYHLFHDCMSGLVSVKWSTYIKSPRETYSRTVCEECLKKLQPKFM
jgi:hypothetical protein